MYNKVILKQPAGIGDIFFCIKIAYALHLEFKCNILWPIIPQYEWIKDYVKYPFIEFVSQKDDYPLKHQVNQTQTRILELEEDNKKYLLVPIQHADLVFPGDSVMEAKYKLVGLDFEDWINFFTFERNIEKENKLYYEVLGLTDDSKYTFVNRKFASPPDTHICKHIDISQFNNFVEMDYIEGYTLFDWCKVLENAEAIHTVDTSIQYLVDKLELNSDLNLYSRFDPPNYYHILKVTTSNWKFN